MINVKQASTCFHLLAGHIVYLLYFCKCQNSKWGFPYVHYCLLDPCPDASLEYAWVLPDSDWSTCSTWETQTYYCLFVMATTLFYSMAHTATSLTFLFFSHKHRLGLLLAFSVWLRPFNYLLYNRRPRFLSMWVWVCLRASVYTCRPGLGWK